MIEILHTDTYRTASDTATIKVQRYIDFGFAARIIWRITIKRDRDELGRILEDQRLTPPSRRTIIRILSQN